MTKPSEGILLIADITGYTGFLSASELEHAQEILASLMELLIHQARPPLVVSKLAGDAVFSYGLRQGFIQGQTFVEMVEETYLAFRKALELMALNNNCQCNACRNIPNLDLKFFVHDGAFAIQHLEGRDELVGPDVILIHRLLKNHVREKTGLRAYTLYTEAAIQRLGIEQISQAMTPHLEEYEHLGEVRAWLQDMHPVWQAKRDAVRVSIPPERTLAQAEIELALPQAVAWDFLIQPEYRKTLMASDRQEVIDRQDGRIAAGSVFHCYHGDVVIPQTILEWQPFERILTQDQITVAIQKITVLNELRLIPIETGTRLVQTISKSSGPLPARLLADRSIKESAKKGNHEMEAFKQRIEDDYSRAGAG